MDLVLRFNNFKDKFFKKIGANAKLKCLLMAAIYCLFFVASFLALALDAISPFNLILIAIWALLILAILLYVFFYGKLILNYYIILLLLFIILQLFSWAINGFGAFTKTGPLLGILSIFLCELLLQDDVQTKKFFFLFLISTWLFFTIFIITNFSGVIRPRISNRIGSNLGNSNDVARHISFAVIVNFCFVFCLKNKIAKIVCIFTSLLGLYLLILTGSVSNLLTVFIVLLFSFFFLLKGKKRLLLLLIIGVFVSFVILLLSLDVFSYFKIRLFGMFNSINIGKGYSGDDSFEARLLGAIYGFKLFLEKPFFGNGFDSVYLNYTIMAHNNIVEILADFGFFALLIEEIMLFIPFLSSFYRKGVFRTIKEDKKLMIFSILLFIILFQFFLVSFNSKIECMLIPLCVATYRIDFKFCLGNPIKVDNYFEVRV